MIDHVKEWERAIATGQHAFEVVIKDKPPYGGVYASYLYAQTREEARAKAAEYIDSDQEEIDEIRLQLPKFMDTGVKLKPGCPCVVCQRD